MQNRVCPKLTAVALGAVNLDDCIPAVIASVQEITGHGADFNDGITIALTNHMKVIEAERLAAGGVPDAKA